MSAMAPDTFASLLRSLNKNILYATAQLVSFAFFLVFVVINLGIQT